MPGRSIEGLAIGVPELTWHDVPTGCDGSYGWPHSGVANLPDGSVTLAHPEGGALIIIDPSGNPRSVPNPLTEMHGLTVADGPAGESLIWVADNGHRFLHAGPRYGEIHDAGRAVALTLEGEISRELLCPSDSWSPTSIAVVDSSDAASPVWLADGYGQSLVHCFDSKGSLITTLDGTDSGQPFACPHGLLVRGDELYVADRSNHRLVVYGADGGFRRVVGAGTIDSPCSLAEYGERLLVTELFGAIAVFEGDAYVGHVGSSSPRPKGPDWPNSLDARGCVVAPLVTAGVFNSPHGICVSGDSIYVTEWLIGGRLVRLSPRRAG